MFLAASKAATFTEIVTPYIPVAVILLGAIAAGIFNSWNRRRGNLETRAPDVNEMWVRQVQQDHELDVERRLRRTLEDFGGMVRRAFRGYVMRVQSGGDNELTAYERKAFDTVLPTRNERDEIWPSVDDDTDPNGGKPDAVQS